MAEEEKKESEKEEEVPPASEKEEEKKEDIEPPETPPSQDEDPVKKELEKIKEKPKKFTRRERLNFEKRKIDEQLGELDNDEGIEPPIDEGDSTPVTVGMLKKREKEQSRKTSIELAEEIEDDDERELTVHYLQTRIVASGNPREDLKFARLAVNSLKNAQIAEETDRKINPKSKGTPPGGPAKHEKAFKPTEQEKIFMKPPYNCTKEDIMKSREQTQAKRSQ